MMITESDVLYNFNSTVRLLPLRVRRYFYGTDTSKIREIRLGVGRAVRVVTDEGIKLLSKSSSLSLNEKIPLSQINPILKMRLKFSLRHLCIRAVKK